MKRSILTLFAATVGMLSMATAQNTVDDVLLSGIKTQRNGEYMLVEMTLHLESLDVDGNRAVLLTPRLVNGTDSLDLASVGIYGRRRYYFYLRNSEDMLSGSNEISYKAKQAPDSVQYRQIVPYCEWMNGSSLTLHRSDYGCCNTLLAQQDGIYGEYVESEVEEAFFPELVYVRPQAELVKSRSLEGSAFIDFPVNKTVIYPDYRRNTAELGKIQATIDSVRNDSDVSITQVWLKGYASPESPYSHNRSLAIGRTEALKKYIQQLYKFDEGIIATDFEPEDWDGLRRYVENSNIDNREQILEIIDSNLEPDPKEYKIKTAYPAQYRFLLQNSYPALRHTDYRIAYDVRSYSDAEDIKRIMRTKPQNLSLNEFYIVAQTYEPGTDEFADVFETAVRMFPDDATANLNAANAAMRKDDLEAAERYLSKAGDMPQTVYARGALAIRKGDIEAARRYLTEAQRLGVEQAGRTLEELEKGKRRNVKR